MAWALGSHGLGLTHYQLPLSSEVSWWLFAAAPLWLFGLCVGVLLPKPRFLADNSARAGALLWTTPPGTALRRVALLFHGAVILRDVWQHSIAAGLHAYLLAIWSWIAGNGWVLATQQPAKGSQPAGQREAASEQRSAPRQQLSQQRIPTHSTADWYVTESDLDFFKAHAERSVPLEGASNWEQQMDKDFETFSYAAWRRTLPSGKTEYKSVTVSLDATAEEFTDFYLDDDVRPTWDGMVTHHDVVENGSPADRCQVVHWIRSFPFAFLGDREYVIARRQFRAANGCIYVITKSIEHPRAPVDDSAVRMDVFYSMWRSRTVPCPRGTGRPACETVLLHHEQFKIPENLARFAVKAGMGGFVRKMGPAVAKFVAERRQRVDPFKPDAEAYGVKRLARSASNASSLASTTGTEYTDGDASVATDDSRYPVRAARPRRRKPKQNGLRRIATLSLGVAAVVLTLQRSRGVPALLGGIVGRLRQQQQQRRRMTAT